MRRPIFDRRGLVPAVVQHADTGEVLMLAYMNEEALAATQTTGLVHFWSRSRRRLWQKGETSGNMLQVRSLAFDCDGDTVLVQAYPAGPACHTGARTCFIPVHESAPQGFARLETLWHAIEERDANRPAGSYTTRLLTGGVDATGRKVLEEAAELVEAAVANQRRTGSAERVAEEGADLVYHLLVLLAERGVPPAKVLDVLADRAR